MVDTSHTPSLGYIWNWFSNIDAATLLPIITAHTAPGHSDLWASYQRVQQLPHVAAHHTVKHSRHFVTTGVYTQNVESYWNRVKTKLKWMKGCLAHQLQSYLDEFMITQLFR